MQRTKRVAFPIIMSQLLLVLCLAPALPAAADPGVKISRDLQHLIHLDLPFARRLDEWGRAYHEINGDREVIVPLAPSGVLSTKAVEAYGYARLDLIGGRVSVRLRGIDQAVDVWLLDNQPGPGRSIRVEKGDRLLRLARLERGVRQVERKLGQSFFRGVEVDRLIVSEAGVSPAESRLLSGSRPLYERLYTQARLTRDGRATPALDFASKAGGSPSTILVSTGEVSPLIFRGGEIFFREAFSGNGRSCGTCHPVTNNLTIDPDFIATLDATDPLFIAEQSVGQPLENLEISPLLRNFGLVLENIANFTDPGERFVMRSVPHTLSMGTSIELPIDENGDIPDDGTFDFLERTGWSGDGSPVPGTLRNFVLGAIFQHYPAVNFENREFIENGGQDFRMPTEGELDAVEAFMLNSGRTAEIDLDMVSLTDMFAEQGRTTFKGTRCNVCHHNAGANIFAILPDGSLLEDGNRNFDTGVERFPNPAQGFEDIFFPFDGGFGGQDAAGPNFDSDGDGVLDSFGNGRFNVPPLIEAADTAPFFHNNISQTVENAVFFYVGTPFVGSPGDFFLDQIGQPPMILGITEILDISSFLQVLNASFNVSISIQRQEAAQRLEPLAATAADFSVMLTVNQLLELANVELEDAFQVLNQGIQAPNFELWDRIQDAISVNKKAISATSPQKRQELIAEALAQMKAVKVGLGSGLDFELGEGNLLF